MTSCFLWNPKERIYVKRGVYVIGLLSSTLDWLKLYCAGWGPDQRERERERERGGLLAPQARNPLPTRGGGGGGMGWIRHVPQACDITLDAKGTRGWQVPGRKVGPPGLSNMKGH